MKLGGLTITFSGTSFRIPYWRSRRNFALGIGCFSISALIPTVFYRSFPIWPFNAFRHVCPNRPEDNCWGVGVLQVGSRHLAGIYSNDEKFQIGLGFIDIVKRSYL